MVSRNPAEPRRRHALRSDTTLLVTIGFALFAAGIALVVAPEYSERARKVADALARLSGIQSGVLLLGGLVFFSLGIFCRRITRLGSTVRSDADDQESEHAVDLPLVLEQLGEDIAQLGTNVNLVRMSVESHSATLRDLAHAQEALANAQAAPSEQRESYQPFENDPLLVFASSLDQMNARLDGGLSALMRRLDERLAGVGDLPELARTDGDARRPAGTPSSLDLQIDFDDAPPAPRSDSLGERSDLNGEAYPSFPPDSWNAVGLEGAGGEANEGR